MRADLDNGYTRIANEMLEALARLDLSGREFRIAITVMRKTYGFQKKADWIAREQLAEITGISKENISRIVNDLVAQKIIVKEGSGYIKKLGMNTQISEWFPKQQNVESDTKHNVESDTASVGNQHFVDANKMSELTVKNVEIDSSSVESDTKDVGKRHPQKKKETITKENTKERIVHPKPLFEKQETEIDLKSDRPVNPFPKLRSLDGIDFSIWQTLPTESTMMQWLKVRKGKGAVMTQLAMDATWRQIERAAEYCDLNAEDCLQYACVKNWGGFVWEYVLNEIKARGTLTGADTLGPGYLIMQMIASTSHLREIPA